MKLFSYSSCLFAFFLVLSCKEKEAQPNKTGLSGTWVLFQGQSWDGSAWISKNVPLSPQQTITFTYPHQVAATAVDDTTLAKATYFEVTGSDIAGPLILFKKSDRSFSGHTFRYISPLDTLYLSPIGLTAGSYRYSFRRL